MSRSHDDDTMEKAKTQNIDSSSPPLERSVGCEARDGRETSLLRQWLSLSLGLLRLVLKRLWHHPGVTLLSLIGISLSVGLVSSAGFFSQAVDQAILEQELEEFSRVTGRPALASRVYVFPSAHRPISLEEAEHVSQFVADILTRQVGLPTKHVRLRVASGRVDLLALEGTALYREGQSLASVTFTYVSDIADEMEVIAGDPLRAGVSEGPLDVWMHSTLADRMGVQIDDAFGVALDPYLDPVRVRVRGLWRPRDSTSAMWFSDPDLALGEALLIRRDDYVTHVEPLLPSRTSYVAWDTILDETSLVPDLASHYLPGFERALRVIHRYYPEARLIHPENPLSLFVRRQAELTALLLSFHVPTFIFLLSFLVLIAVIAVYWQRHEIAVLVSRGGSTANILVIAFLENCVLIGLGYPLGICLGMLLAQTMGRTTGFLQFYAQRPLPVSFHGASVSLVALALAVALMARTWPAVQAARKSVVLEEREYARPVQGPFWHRNYVDLLLVIPTAYAYFQITSRASLVQVLHDAASNGLYQEPLLILVPALFVLTTASLTMRFFPVFTKLLDLLAGLVTSPAPHLALRQLGRYSHSYLNPLLLVIVTLAMGIYMLSMATSLDQWVVDQTYHEVGSDVAFEPFVPRDGGALVDFAGADWIPPVNEFLALPGVSAAARVGTFRAAVAAGREQHNARLMAIDRHEFPHVAWFREDNADESLGALMNRLALEPRGVLAPIDYLDQYHLGVGDPLLVNVNVSYGHSVSVPFRIVGAYRYFPTVRTGDLVLIENIDYLSLRFGASLPHHIWFKVEEDADGQAIFRAVPTIGVESVRRRDARAMLIQEQERMERVGVLGSLSGGFLAMCIMSIMGLLDYSYASLKDRLHQFALTRALGCTRAQIVAYVGIEYLFLLTYAIIMGLYLGASVSRFFIPLLRTIDAKGPVLPPLLPNVPATQVGSLVAAFAMIVIVAELIIVITTLRHSMSERLRWGSRG